MSWSKDDFINNWKSNIEDFQDELYFPYSSKDNSEIVKELSSSLVNSPDLKKNLIDHYSHFTDFNATIGQNDEDYQYSYEEGYYKAFKSVIASSPIDSDSFLMPALFLARHYIEICLKDEIINVSIAIGAPFTIGKTNNHKLKQLGITFKKLLDDNELNILKPEFFEIIYLIDELTPHSDEYRYEFDKKGEFSLPIEVSNGSCSSESPQMINLVELTKYLNYLYINFYSLLFILNFNGESVLGDTPFANPYVKGLLYGILYSKVSKDFFKDFSDEQESDVKSLIKDIVGQNNLLIKDIEVKFMGNNKKIQVSMGENELFSIFKNKNLWKLQTPSVING